MKLSTIRKRWLGVILIAAIVGAGLVVYLSLPKVESEEIEAIKVGEELTYNVYTGENYTPENLIGTFTMEVLETMTYQGTNCYRADYLLTFDNSIRSGSMLFDRQGRLRYYVGYSQQDENAQWLTQVTYYLTLNRMRVRVVYPDSVTDNELEIPASATISQHFLYLLRLESLENGYYKEFNFSYIPNATQTVAVGVSVSGEATVEVPEGSYDCWVVDTSGGYVARFWVSKEQKFVVKFAEDSSIYTLQELKYWQ